MDSLKKILIVEDEEPLRRLLHRELARDGIIVLEAENGETALTLAFHEHPNLILLDVIMPKMHGMDFLRRLQEDAWGKKVPVLLLTNFAEDPRVVEAVKEGRCEVLKKAEIKLEEVISKVKEKLKG